MRAGPRAERRALPSPSPRVLSERRGKLLLNLLEADGRFSKMHRTEARDEEGRVCAVVDTEVYLRLPRPAQSGSRRSRIRVS